MQFAHALASSPQTTAYGDLYAVSSNPIAQMQFTYNVNACLAEETITGSSSIVYQNGMAVLQVNQSGDSASLSNKIRAYAQPGQDVYCVFAAMYGSESSATSQIAGMGNETDGFFFECTNSTFGILYRNNSQNVSIPQMNWNVDPMDGSGPSGMMLDYTRGNIYKIEYQRLEFGYIKFFIETPDTGKLVLVHQINYANMNTTPSLSNPGLQLMAEVVSSGGAAALNISSMGLFIEGEVNPFLGIRNSISGSATVSSVISNILTIQNEPIFGSQINESMVLPDQLSLFNSPDSNDNAIFSLYLNPAIDSPQYFNVSSTSTVTYDTEGTFLSGGVLLGTFYLSSGSSLAVNLHAYGILLAPGDRLVFTCASSTSLINVYISTSWLEQF